MDGFTAVRQGRTIMRRYNNPARWVDGATVHAAFRGKMAVQITETQVGPDNPAAMAVANTAAIIAWARSVEFLPQNRDPEVMNMPDSTTYLVVPKQHWERVQQKLAAL